MIGKHQCQSAFGRQTRLKNAIHILLDELFTAVEESFGDLTDAQAWAFPVPGHNNVAWIVMHCLDNLDGYTVGAQTGRRLTAPDPRWNLWGCRPEERPKPGDRFPSVGEMLALLAHLRDHAMAAIDAQDEARLTAPDGDPARRISRSDFYMRTINHTEAHLRQIWLLRGALGLIDGNSRRWPQQHWA